MSEQAVHFSGVLPIAVGSRVEVRVFLAAEGLFTTTWTPRPDQPLVTDLTTGVVYGSVWHFQEVNMYQAGQVREDLPVPVRTDLREHARMVGKVKACRIAWIGAGDSRYAQTTLVLQLD